jgi:transposase
MDPTNDIDLSALDPPARMIVQVLRAALAESEARTARLQESVAALSDQIATLTREWREQRETAEKAAAEQLEAAQKAAAEQLGTLQEQIEIRDEQLAELRKRIFGKSSEKMPRIRTEVDEALLAEAEATLATSEEDAAPEKTSEERTAERRKKGRAKSKRAREAARLKRKELPVVRQVVNVTDEQIPDGYSREDFVALGGEPKITRRVEHVREHLVVTEYVMETLVTKSGGVMVCAESPPSVCDGGHYGASVYAHVIVSKCADSLPLYRIERQLAREGASIARSVLCGLFHTGAELLLPIWERLLGKRSVRASVHG